MSKMDLSPEELERVKVPRLPTTVITASGWTDTTYEATVYAKDLDIIVTVQLLEDTPAVLTLRKTCEEWKEGHTPNLMKNGKSVSCKCDNFVPIVVLDRSSEAHLASSAEDSAESTKEMTPDEQEMTQASRGRLQDLPEWFQGCSGNLVRPRSTSSGNDSRDPPGNISSTPSTSQSTHRKAQSVHTLSQGSRL